MKRKILGFIPLLDRYLILSFLKFLFLVNAVLLAVVIISLSIYYFNISKISNISLMVKYALSTSLANYIYLFPLTIIASFFLLNKSLFKKRLIYVFFSNGISPKRLALPFFWLGAVFTALYLLFFQFGYPYFMLKSTEAYYESKKKVFNTGIAENFWYKNGNGFLYFRILELKSKMAYRGFKFKLNSGFQIEQIAPVETAQFEFNNGKIIFHFPELKFYSFGGVRTVKNEKEKLNYDIKLLKVKKPDFVTLSDLVDIALKERYLKLNLTSFLWELWKRFELSVFIFLLTLLSALKVFKTWQQPKINKNFLCLSVYILTFYAGIFSFQNLVNEISLNPIYSLLILAVFVLPLIWELKRKT